MSFDNNYNNLDDLINKYNELYPGKSSTIYELLKSLSTREYFENTIKTNPELKKLLKSSINNPSLIIFYIRKERLKILKDTNDYKLANIVFNVYIDSIIKKKFPELSEGDYNIAKNQELTKLSARDYDNLKKRVFVLYENKKLSKDVVEEINKKHIKIISKEEYDFSQTFKIPEIIEEPEKKITKEIKIYTGSPNPNYISDLDLIKENSYQLLSPVYYTGMLKIDGLFYPTVSHYITANLFTTISTIKNLNEAQKYIIKNLDNKDWNNIIPQNWIDYREVYKKFSVLKLNDISMKLKYFAKIALDKKFENLLLQNILLKTENKLLIWKDINDDVLGIGKNGQGENFVGKYLMSLRDKYFKLHTDDEFNIVKENTLVEIMETDSFINEWVKMRVKDFINVSKNCRLYYKNKTNTSTPFNYQYLKIVLDNIYPQCTDISPESTLEIPLFFINIVLDNIQSSKESSGIISLLWTRIISMLYFIMKSLDNPSLTNIRNFIIKIQDIVYLQNNNVTILKSRIDNCIISAIINILLGIEKYNIESSRLTSAVTGVVYDPDTKIYKNIYTNINPKLGKEEVELAVSILLNVFIKNINISYDTKYKDIGVPEREIDFDINIDDKIFDENKILIDDEIQFERDEDDNLIEKEEDNVAEEEIDDEEKEYEYAEESESEGEREEKEQEDEDYFYDYGENEIDGAETDIIDNTDNEVMLSRYIIKNNLFNSTPEKVKEYYVNSKKIAKFILSGVEIVKNYKLNKKVKNNRINFFSQC